MKNLIILHGETQEINERSVKPFFSEDSDLSYAYFTELCKKHDIHCVFSHPLAYRDRGVGSAWHHNGTQWIQEREVRADAIQDRFSAPDKVRFSEIYENLVRDRELLVNSPELERLCKDKFPNRAYFSNYFIPTLIINGKVDIEETKKTFAPLNERNPDFNENILIFKPRYGSEGVGFYTHPKMGHEIEPPSELSHYVCQPFLETNKGIPELHITRRHDVRTFIVNGKIEYVEARQLKEEAKNKVFYPKSNVSEVSFFAPESLPEEMRIIAKDIDASLAYDLYPRMYGIDFAQGISGRCYVFELNTRLNQTWNKDSSEEIKIGRKNLQEIVIKEIANKLERG